MSDPATANESTKEMVERADGVVGVRGDGGVAPTGEVASSSWDFWVKNQIHGKL